MSMKIDLLVDNLIKQTKKDKLTWKKVSKNQLYKLIDRSIGEGKINSAYYIEREDSEIVAVGKTVKSHWVSEDQSVLDDYYFITLTDSDFEDPITFFESDEEINDYEFPFELARLYRLIRLNYSSVESKINKWLDEV